MDDTRGRGIRMDEKWMKGNGWTWGMTWMKSGGKGDDTGG